MATPSRTTRARSSRATTPQPLPVVEVRLSHGYGSRGKAHLANQLAAEGTTLEEGFTTARAGAKIAAVLEESEDEDDDQDVRPPPSRTGTFVGTANYESTVRSQRHDSMPPPSPRRTDAFFDTDDEPPSSPWTLSVILFAIPRYLWRNFWALLVGALLLGTAAHITLPARAADRRDEFFRGLKIAAGVPGYDQPPAYLEKLWMFVRYKAFLKEELEELSPVKEPILQSMINVRLRGLISDLQGNHTALEDRVSEIEAFLPPRTVVNVVDGNMIISDNFWHAITSKIQGSDDLFDAFVSANEESATRIAEAAGASSVEEALKNKRVLGRDELMDLLNDNGKDLEKRISSLVQSGTDHAIAAARTIAAQVAREIAENTPNDIRAQLSVLAKSNLLVNTYDTMSSVSWFSPKIGAIVDPHHTSPTYKKPPRVPSGGWFAKSIKRHEPGPIAALMPWEETGDCWCAAKTDNIHMGQAQLAVFTDKKIKPKRLIVEHILPDGSEDITNAPKDFELWADLLTVEAAETMKHRLRQRDSHYDRGCPLSQVPPSESSICIASGYYDIHQGNWVQSVPMLFDAIDMDETGFEAGKFYYRVVTNWGADQTCLYRVRLTEHKLLGSE